MVRVIAFDLWNTLIFLEKGWRTFNQLKPFIEKDDVFWREKVKPIYLCKKQDSPLDFLQDLETKLGIDVINLEDELIKQLQYDLENTKLYSDSIPCLERCRENGLKLAVISNQCSFYMPSYYSLCLDKYFDFALFSFELGYGKPDERIYRKLAEVSDEDKSDILVIGNHKRYDCQKPIEMGFKGLHLARNNLGRGINQIKNLDEIRF